MTVVKTVNWILFLACLQEADLLLANGTLQLLFSRPALGEYLKPFWMGNILKRLLKGEFRARENRLAR